MYSTRMPKLTNHALKRDKPAGPVEPKGWPLSVRMISGRPKRPNKRFIVPLDKTPVLAGQRLDRQGVATVKIAHGQGIDSLALPR